MNTKHSWVILFDIDGTLLTVDRNYNRPLLRGILDDLKIDYPDMESDPFSGRTDHDILSSFLANHGHSTKLYKQIKSTYLERINSTILPEHVYRQPFVDEAIEYFEAIGSYIGLLTGNYPIAASAKLRAAKINYSFSFGAFGEFHKDRNELPFLAIDQIKEQFGFEPDPSRFVIIGDTPRDIECAKKAGMKSVALTTGTFTKEELQKGNPDIILGDLSQPEKWFPMLSNK